MELGYGNGFGCLSLSFPAADFKMQWFTYLTLFIQGHLFVHPVLLRECPREETQTQKSSRSTSSERGSQKEFPSVCPQQSAAISFSAVVTFNDENWGRYFFRETYKILVASIADDSSTPWVSILRWLYGEWSYMILSMRWDNQCVIG